MTVDQCFMFPETRAALLAAGAEHRKSNEKRRVQRDLRAVLRIGRVDDFEAQRRAARNAQEARWREVNAEFNAARRWP